jgi:hypothetical protein
MKTHLPTFLRATTLAIASFGVISCGPSQPQVEDENVFIKPKKNPYGYQGSGTTQFANGAGPDAQPGEKPTEQPTENPTTTGTPTDPTTTGTPATDPATTPPDGSNPPTATKPTTPSLPFGTPVIAKKGFVYSPYAPEKGMVDVSEIPSGTKVECPYTGKHFRVP